MELAQHLSPVRPEIAKQGNDRIINSALEGVLTIVDT